MAKRREFFKKHRKCGIFLAFFGVVLPLSVPFMTPLSDIIPFNNKEAIQAEAEVDTSKPEYYLKPSTGGGCWEWISDKELAAVTLGSETAYVWINFSRDLDEDVTVFYHTENYTAVDGKDYTGVKNATIKVSKNSYGKFILINDVKNCEYETRYEFDPAKGYEIVNSRAFKVIVDKVVGDTSQKEYPARNSNETLKFDYFKKNGQKVEANLVLSNTCYVLLHGKNQYSLIKENTGKYCFADYLLVNAIDTYPFRVDSYPYVSTFELDFNLPGNESLYSKYFATNIADLYFSQRENKFRSESSSDSLTTMATDWFVGNGSMNVESATYNNDFYSVHPSVGMNNVSWRFRSHLPNGLIDDKALRDVALHSTEPHEPISDTRKYSNCISATYNNEPLAAHYFTQDNVDLFYNLGTVTWLPLPRPKSMAETTVKWAVTSYNKSYDLNMKLISRIADRNSPKITDDCKNFAFYPLSNGDTKVIFTMEFNEPIQTKESLSLDIKLNNEYKVKLSLDKKLAIGTDRLCFTGIIPKGGYNKAVTYVVTGDVDHYFNKVEDMADEQHNYINYYDVNDSKAWSNKTYFDTTIDFRTPTISVDAEYRNQLQPKNNVQVRAQIGNISEGIVQYQFIRSNGGIPVGPDISDDAAWEDTTGVSSGDKAIGKIEIKPDSSRQGDAVNASIILDHGNNKLFDGKYYLFMRVKSIFGTVCEIDNGGNKYYGPYNLSLDVPETTVTPSGQADERRFSVVVNSKATVSEVKVKIKCPAIDDTKVYEETYRLNELGVNLYSTNISYTFKDLVDKYFTNSDTGLPMLKDYASFMFQFEVSNNAGNPADGYKIKINEQTYSYASDEWVEYFFSENGTFDCDFVASTSQLKDDIYVFNTNTTFTFTGGSGEANPINVSINGSAFLSTCEKPLDGYSLDTNTNNKAILQLTKPGRYEVICNRNGMISEKYIFYITNSFEDNTTNFINVTDPHFLPINSVYALGEGTKFYYSNGNSIFNENYGNTNNPVFSSQQAAINFLTSYEYLDLSLEQLTKQTADDLSAESGGSRRYRKAENETHAAVMGSWWIRYKNTNWTPGSSESSWVYYYYADNVSDNTVNILNLSDLLQTAISTTVNRIMASGRTVYLIDGENVNSKTYAPYLSDAQKELSDGFILSTSKTGNGLSGASYSGDYELFSNKVNVSKGEETISLPLATNLLLDFDGGKTRIFVAPYTGSSTYEYREVPYKENLYLYDAINTASSVGLSEIYSVLEIGALGAHKFEVYVDKVCPEIKVNINGNIIPISETSTNQYGKSLSVLPGDTKDIDSYAFVAIYKGITLVKFQYLSKFNDEFSLQSGTYTFLIGDRSGNTYSLKVFINDEEIITNVITTDTRIIAEITNRTPDELTKFEVLFNDIVLDNKLEVRKMFSQSGTYQFTIEDQYGFQVRLPATQFSRVLPQVLFYYFDEVKILHPYNERTTTAMLIEPVGENFHVATSAILSINVNREQYNFQIEGCDPNCYTVNGNTITFNRIVPFNLIVSYLDSENDKIIYNVTTDTKAPDITGVYVNSQIKGNEFIQEKNEDGFFILPNFDIDNNEPKVITTSFDGKQKELLINYGDKIDAKYVRFTINDDESRVKLVEIFLDGKLFKTITPNTASSVNFYLDGKFGTYTVRASDIFNHTTSLNFEIKGNKLLNCEIDGKQVEESSGTYYGNSNVTANFTTGEVATVKISGAQKGTFIFNVTESGIYRGTYQVSEDLGAQNLNIVYEATPFIGFPYKPFEDVDLVFNANKDGTLNVTYNQEDVLTNIELRALRNNECSNYYSFELSKEQTEVSFIDQDHHQLEIRDGYIYASVSAKPVELSEKIISSKIAYNAFEEKYEDRDFVDFNNGYQFKGDGFYRAIFTNRYGNQSVYNFIIANGLVVNITEMFKNKESEVYKVSYADEYYANSAVQILGYKMLEMNCETGGIKTIDGEKTYLLFDQPGTYSIYLKDINLNEKTITVIIDSLEVSFDENWVTGYNERALYKDKGYSNQKLSINLTQASLNEQEIRQVFYKVNDTRVYLYGYDPIKGEFVPYVEDNFKNCIGNDGDGVYEIYFSNKFGDISSKEIHYQEYQTLYIYRLTNQDLEEDIVPLTMAIEEGIWSNQKVRFESELPTDGYEFKVKSGSGEYVKQSITYPFELTDISAYGEVHYDISYLDAYGNYYEMSVNLLKRQLSFDLTNTSFFELDNGLYTRNNFSFKYDENEFYINYGVDGSDYINAYASESIISKDGVYNFEMHDNAGNRTMLKVTKDSTVNFSVESKDDGSIVVFGTVVNANSVTVRNLEDYNIEILSLKLDGNEIEPTMTFTKTGHYEFVAKDRAGNLRYFDFTLVNHQLKDFEYQGPASYQIVEGYYTNKEGVRVTCMDKIDKTLNQIKLVDASDGTYEFVLKNPLDNTVIPFTVVITHDIPKAKLNGVNPGETTTREVNISNLTIGDTVQIYKDGKLIQEVKVDSTKKVPTITKGGRYKVVVTNEAGMSVSYEFNKLIIANTPLSILIIVLLSVGAVGLFLGLVLRNRGKNDR